MAVELKAIDLSNVSFATEIKQNSQILYFRKAFSEVKEGYKTARHKRPDIPIWEKSNLTIEECALYSGIGRDKLRELTEREDCPFVLWIGSKRLIRRKKFDEYLDRAFSL